MQSLKRAILYPIVGWFIWMAIIMTLYGVLPDSVRSSAFFVGMGATLSAGFVVLFAVLYLRKVGRSTVREGLFVGLLATIIVIVLDIVHNIIFGIDMGRYVAYTLPTYFIIPLTTTLVLGYLKKK